MINSTCRIVSKQSPGGCNATRSVMNGRVAVNLVLGVACIQFASFTVLNDTIHWCFVSDDGYVSYNAKNFACLNCTGKYHIVDRKTQATRKCLDDGKLGERCNADETECGDGGCYKASERCDGMKNCVNFRDELNCTKQCEPADYSCYNSKQDMNATDQCVRPNQVCDGRKDCISGMDESNCMYYGGRCNGFTCTKIEECVDITKVCDHVKDCLDGTDETMCQGCMTPGGFECKDAQGVIEAFTSNTICNGVADCRDKQDEHYCFKWSQWSTWSQCSCNGQNGQDQTATRTRTCGTLHNHVDSSDKCQGNTEEKRACQCGSPSPSKSQIISYTLIGLISFILVAGGIILCRASRRHKKAWLSYTRAGAFFRPTKNDTLIDTVQIELRQDSQPQTLSERMLASDPPSDGLTPPILRFHRSSSYQDSYDNQEDSILAPMEEDNGLQSLSVANPLYHSYRGIPQNDVYNRLTATGYDSYNESLHSSRENLIASSDEEGDTRLTEQIEVARMGNLIETSDLTIH